MKKKRNYKEEFRVLLILIIIAFTVKTSVAEIYVVPTGSMEDTDDEIEGRPPHPGCSFQNQLHSLQFEQRW